MNRRRFLSALAAAGALTAGCIGDGGTNDPAGGPGTDGGTGTPTPPDADSGDGGTDGPPDGSTAGGTDTAVRVESLTLQRGLVVPSSPDSIGVDHGDHRYLWAEITAGENAPEPDAFSLEVHPDTYDPLAADDHRAYRTTWGDGSYYDGTRGTGLLLFELPLEVDAPRVELQTPDGHVRADESLTDRLGRAPPSTSASLEKRYAETPNAPVAVEVTNEGDVTGRFLGAVNRVGPRVAYTPVRRVSLLVEPGETRTVPVEDPLRHRTESPDDGEPDMTYHLHWVDGSDGAVFGAGE